LGDKLIWRKPIPFTIQNVLTFVDSQPGLFKILLNDGNVFTLVRSQAKSYWLGVLKNSEIWPILQREEIIRVSKELIHQIKVKALTHCLLIGKAQRSLKEELMNLLHRRENPCINKLIQQKVPLFISYKETSYLQEFYLELKHFLVQTSGICPPAHCGAHCCEEAGGVSVPVIINKEEVC
jgi:hypothetical protein